MPESVIAAAYGSLLDRVLHDCERTIEDLTLDEINRLPHPTANSVGFDIWHAVRTIDNIVFFVFDREQPVWLTGGFDVRFGLPRVQQGTGMDRDEAHALRFPAPGEFLEYVRGVREACVPRVTAMTDAYLAESVLLRPWGERPRLQHMGQLMVVHAMGHIGQASLARTLLGRSDLGF